MLYELWSLLSIEHREWIMAIGELERTGKEEVVSISRYSADIHLEGPRKAMKYSQDSSCPGQDSNRVLPEYRPDALPLSASGHLPPLHTDSQVPLIEKHRFT
ncbi:hypothetical protein B7P43_G16120 [Cryptotermes secundus]|uniref:Uncharacterized protein n=1 Tax=Cryptotermes secundus TaxID=105785 RepID=A0A2J7QWW6_9NEOP|nr:hypothetical protein B7P43_G16120 [Cryptotermes secundus]